MDYVFLNKTGSSNIRTKNTQLTIVNNPQRDVKLERNTPLCVCVCVCSQSCPTLRDPVDDSLPPGNFPGKNTGVGCHFLLQYPFISAPNFPSLDVDPPFLSLLFYTAKEISFYLCPGSYSILHSQETLLYDSLFNVLSLSLSVDAETST